MLSSGCLLQPVKSTVTVLKFNRPIKCNSESDLVLCLKYGSSIKSPLSCSQSGVVGRNNYQIPRQGRGKKMGKEKPNGREGHANPICKHFPEETWLHRWCPGWIIKGFSSLSSQGCHEVHRETRQCFLPSGTHQRFQRRAQEVVPDQGSVAKGVSALHPWTINKLLMNKTSNGHHTHQEYSLIWNHTRSPHKSINGFLMAVVLGFGGVDLFCWQTLTV